MSNKESTDTDLGPLNSLIGTWIGDKGRDVSPEPDGSEENLYRETLVIEPVGDVTNAERQELLVVRYLQIVHRKSDNKAIHNEQGYWIWDAQSQTIMNSLIIPRAVCVLAGGKVKSADGTSLNVEVSASQDDLNYGIVQQSFMQEQARTVEFRRRITVDGNTLTYTQTTVVEIYGKTFDHTDENQLTRG
ncbi:MAG: FABP family protein [Fuerstiella sp.]|nr:FABP family protein [Fuerstiella sp.]MCP4855417.1 FABP family protein [Fuerstiella sp.]